MEVYRLSKLKYAKTLSGYGAALFGNRWNSKGVEVIYTAESRALAMAEVAVHLTVATLPKNFMMMEITIPDRIKVIDVDPALLKPNWNEFPHHMHTQQIGDEFVQSNAGLLLRVPSAVVQGDFNYVINPSHKDFSKVEITTVSEFPFDKRIFKI